jgi:hypothetical protein
MKSMYVSINHQKVKAKEMMFIVKLFKSHFR